MQTSAAKPPAKLLTLPGPKQPTAEEVASTVDEFGRLDESLRAPKARHELLRKRILGWHTDLPPGHYAAESGKLYDLEITPKQNERKVTQLAKLLKHLGMKRFIAICKVTIEALENAVVPESRAQFITEDRTGGRKIVVTKRLQEVA